VPLSVVDAVTGAVLCQWTGPGGDSLGIGHDAIWLTDYHAGTVSRLELADSLARCRSTPRH
jgi:virginiamycin B lyase